MQARRKRVLAVAGIAAVAILAGVLIALTAYPQGGGLSSNPCPGLSPCPFAVSGDITIGTDQGAGMITLTVVNQANLPFIDIHLVNAGPNLTGISGFTPFTLRRWEGCQPRIRPGGRSQLDRLLLFHLRRHQRHSLHADRRSRDVERSVHHRDRKHSLGLVGRCVCLRAEGRRKGSGKDGAKPMREYL